MTWLLSPLLPTLFAPEVSRTSGSYRKSLHSIITSALCKGFLSSGMTLKDITCKGLGSRLLRGREIEWNQNMSDIHIKWNYLFYCVEIPKKSNLQGCNLTDSKNSTFCSWLGICLPIPSSTRIICQSDHISCLSHPFHFIIHVSSYFTTYNVSCWQNCLIKTTNIWNIWSG